ncbi:uncharacterized protein LY89DRAFT_737590 [Mollisia scopiformis]|uniref:Uncharacterized protein n=1 Tax=Mollisia scopiformis TaxID=149040 RepID=A0A194X0A0_MOLSC|nr:uncharacterized protein LY89DRAFT_737590 [Mollisia scopiformis]KUJ13621.1 hypothetical protein LY89DRAFT_737590 [Mollisia scopiformis]
MGATVPMLVDIRMLRWLENITILSQVYGTSALSPSWAVMIALINGYRISEGKSTLGFLKRLLRRSARSALNDITTGHNHARGTYGYPAVTGWDPTTGLGFLNFAKLRKALG